MLAKGGRSTAAETGDLCLSSEQIAGQPKQRPSSLSLASLSLLLSLGCGCCPHSACAVSALSPKIGER